MVTIVGNDEHRRRRRVLSHPYSNSYILNSQTLDSIISRVSGRIKEGMAGWASIGTSVDVFLYTKCAMLDIVSGFLFGRENATDTLRDPVFENNLATLAKVATKNIQVQLGLGWPMTYFTSLLGDNKVPDLDATAQWQAWLTRMITNCYKSHPTKSSSTASLYDHFAIVSKLPSPRCRLTTWFLSSLWSWTTIFRRATSAWEYCCHIPCTSYHAFRTGNGCFGRRSSL